MNVELTISLKEGTNQCYSLTMKHLNDNTLVSGNSNGNLQFYETKFGSLVQNIKKLEAEIKTLAVNSLQNASKLFFFKYFNLNNT